MRARNIKPGFFKNEELAECDPLARILFSGLWCMADRSGRMEYRPKRIKAELLPYDNCNVEKLLKQLLDKNFIMVYEVEGKKYLLIPKFTEHQHCNVKEQESTIPAPCLHSACTEQKRPHTEYPILNTEYPILNKTSFCPEPETDTGHDGKNHEPKSPIFISLPTNKNGEMFEVAQPYVDELKALFPAVDVEQQLRSMWAWFDSNPVKRKTKSGMKRFITGWLSRDQNRGGANIRGEPNIFSSSQQKSDVLTWEKAREMMS